MRDGAHTSCVICMDSLFNRRDDLDEVLPIAAPDCGHVFHEKCLLEWFRTQTDNYIAQQRQHGHRASSPSNSDAPAECPTCRAECFADQETGNPQIHRLYINFGDGVSGGSSQMGSSPIRTRWKKSKGSAEAEVMGLARRAKGLGEEVTDLNEEGKEVDQEEMGRVLHRAEGFQEDLISQKAVEGIRKYVGGLTAALNNLRTSLATNPLIPILRQQTAAAQAAQADVQRQMRDLVQTHIPQEVQRAVAVEQLRFERKVKKVKEEMQLVQRELDKEQVLRRTGRKEMEERLAAEVKKTANATELARKETADREAINATLTERTRSLRIYQAKAASSKVLKQQVQNLERERDELRARLDLSAKSSTSKIQTVALSNSGRAQEALAGDEGYEAGDIEVEGNEELDNPVSLNGGSPDKSADLSIVEIDPNAFRAKRTRLSSAGYDESLEVDLPSFTSSSKLPLPDLTVEPTRNMTTYREDALSASLYKSIPLPDGGSSSKRPRPHPTARTVRCDLFEGNDDLDVLDGISLAQAPRSRSKYFDTTAALNDAAGVSSRSGLLDSGPTYSLNNPFRSSKEDTERRKVLHNRARHDEGEPSIRSASRPKPSRVLDLSLDSSPEPSTRKRLDSDAARVLPDGIRKLKSVTEMLGMTDKHGRPVKGLATGAKAKRRA